MDLDKIIKGISKCVIIGALFYGGLQWCAASNDFWPLIVVGCAAVLLKE